MNLKRADLSNKSVTPERFITLADGVFAIVMTLLVLELSIPAVKGMSASAELWHHLYEMLPEFLIYGLSFMVLGVFWVIHHSIYVLVTRYDTTLVWLNILYLMFVSLIPFSTALVGKNGFISTTAILYGFNMLILFNLGLITFSFVTGKRGLAGEWIDATVVRGGKWMGFVYNLIMLPAIALAMASPRLSFGIYGLFVFTFIIITLLGKGEIAMLLPVPEKSDADNT